MLNQMLMIRDENWINFWRQKTRYIKIRKSSIRFVQYLGSLVFCCFVLILNKTLCKIFFAKNNIYLISFQNPQITTKLMGLRTWTSYTQKERNLIRFCIFKNLIFLIFLLHLCMFKKLNAMKQ